LAGIPWLRAEHQKQQMSFLNSFIPLPTLYIFGRWIGGFIFFIDATAEAEEMRLFVRRMGLKVRGGPDPIRCDRLFPAIDYGWDVPYNLRSRRRP
jgi:hypothetical protein